MEARYGCNKMDNPLLRLIQLFLSLSIQFFSKKKRTLSPNSCMALFFKDTIWPLGANVTPSVSSNLQTVIHLFQVQICFSCLQCLSYDCYPGTYRMTDPQLRNQFHTASNQGNFTVKDVQEWAHGYWVHWSYHVLNHPKSAAHPQNSRTAFQLYN